MLLDLFRPPARIRDLREAELAVLEVNGKVSFLSRSRDESGRSV
jgi:uncharacterized membrane protein YcaP (DUF421 family)